ncbi:MAG: hypothetical protein U0930_22295 [Pirellulales bacterium]
MFSLSRPIIHSRPLLAYQRFEQSGEGGNDIVNFNGNGAGDITATFATITSVGETGFQTIGLSDVENLNVNAAGRAANVVGTAGADQLQVTPTSAAGATVRLLSSSPVTTTPNINLSNVTSLSIDAAGGSDSVTVIGTSSNDSIGVAKGASSVVSVNALLAVSILAASTELILVDAGDGNDTTNVTGTTASGQQLSILGGSPTSNAGAVADVLNVTLATAGTTAAVPGSTPDAGVITNPDGNINYSGIEFFNVTGAAGANTFNIQGTHDNDTIALQFLAGANRVWVNNRAVYTFANYPIVNINGLFGDDKINVLPVGLVGVATINVAGGDPTASDELVVTGTAAQEAVGITPTAPDAGSVTGLGPVINFTTIEKFIYNGLGGNDVVTVTGTAADDIVSFSPGTTPDSGTFNVNSLVPIGVTNIGLGATLNLNGAGGTDTLVSEGTDNSDTASVSAAGLVKINGNLAVTPLSIENARLNMHDGDDIINVTAGQPFAILTIDAGSPSASDTLNLIGATGDVSVDWQASSVSGYGGVINYIALETINADVNALNATLLGTNGSDSIQVSTNGQTVTTRLTGSVPSFSDAPVVNFANVGTTMTVDGGLGTNQLEFLGTAGADQFNISRDPTNRTIQSNADQIVSLTNSFFAWNVRGGAGFDTFSVNEPNAVNGIELTIDGGTGENRLIQSTAFSTTYVPGGIDRGELIGGASIFMIDIASATVNLVGPATFATVEAGDSNNAITVSGNGASSATISVDESTVVNFGGALNLLFVNGNGGNDNISVTAGGYVGNLQINGGEPTASDSVVINGRRWPITLWLTI